jgi:hypothetical protein
MVVESKNAFDKRGRKGRCAIGTKGCEDEKGWRMRKGCEGKERMPPDWEVCEEKERKE